MAPHSDPVATIRDYLDWQRSIREYDADFHRRLVGEQRPSPTTSEARAALDALVARLEQAEADLRRYIGPGKGQEPVSERDGLVEHTRGTAATSGSWASTG